MVGKLWYLNKFNLFSDLDQEELKDLAEKTEMESYNADETVYLSGAPAETIYILKEGRVRLSRTNPDGRKITVAVLEPGQIFGETALGDSPYEREAKTVQDSLVCSVSDDEFRSFLSRHPELNFEITQLVGERRRQVEAKIENLLFKDSEQRVVFVLRDLFENHSRSSDNGPEIDFTHEQIANLSGLTRPTTSKVLNDLEEQGIIELERGSLKLRDSGALHRLGE